MAQRQAPELRGLEVGVGDLEGHADREREIAEVRVRRTGGSVELDPTLTTVGRAVVEAGVLQREDRVHQQPRDDDRSGSDAHLDVLHMAMRVVALHDRDRDGTKARHCR